MSVHKKDIEDLLETFTKTLAKGNNSALTLIPHLVTALVKYVEEAADYTPAPVERTESKVEVLPTKLPEEDKVFAEFATAAALRENGNATIETDKGNVSIDIGDGVIDELTEQGVDVAQEVATAIVADAEAEGATEVTAVTSKKKPAPKK